YATNPEKLGAAIEYVTKGAKELKLKATPHQIEAQIEASLANFQRDPVGTVKEAKEVTNEVFDNAEKVAELVAPIINGTEGI
ncbi:phage holin, partial [Lactococcus hircilactis]